MKKIIVMGIPHHGNIGDNAIAIAEEKMLEENFHEYKIYYMQEKYLDVCAKRVKRFINDEDIIFLHGGGNIGDTYERPEKGRREVLKLYPNNKIIIFPQTAYFSDTEKGRNELEISKTIYNNHKDLTILAREKKSYDFMKEHFYNAKVYLTPDIVMTLNEQKEIERKDSALLLFRGDTEKTLENDQIEKIKEIMQNKYESIKISDMSLGSGIVNIQGELRNKIFNDKLDEFRNSKIVITDRLHAMIFAAITGTPCIAFGNFNYKISGSYEWLKNLGYIKYCDDITKFEVMLEELNKVTKFEYDNKCAYDNKFANEVILNIIKDNLF